MMQVACDCGRIPIEKQLAESFLLLLQQPPVDLNSSNCTVCLADSLQELDVLASAKDVLHTDSRSAQGYCKQCSASLAIRVWTVSSCAGAGCHAVLSLHLPYTW